MTQGLVVERDTCQILARILILGELGLVALTDTQ